MPSNRGRFPYTLLFIGALYVLLMCENAVSSHFKTERPPYEDFLNYGIKKTKPGNENENEIIKSKVQVLGQVLKKHVDRLRKSPGQNVDLVFLVDSSASVGAENFFNELKFVKKLLADFTVSYNQTRVAVITFSSRAKVIRHIDHVTKASVSNHKCSLLEKELPQIRYSGGGTYTLGAVMEAQRVLAISRNDATKAVFLITDGYSNGGDPRPAAEFLKNRGVIMFTFGIQNGNVKELYDMASEPKEEHSYILNSFQEFEALARRALHEDLRDGKKISQNPWACAKLCDGGRDCCDEYARCTCGTHTGHFACSCARGFYGNGLKRNCFPCPMGTYQENEGAGDITGCKPCPDPNMISPEQSTSIHHCYCKRGYTQNGLQCKRRQCSALIPPENGYFIRGTCEMAVNAACGVRCNPGYNLEGSSIRLCREDGTWTGVDATCIMKKCKKPKAPVNGGMNCSSESTTIDTQCDFTCNPGFQLVGSRTRTCLPVAMWDGIRAYCRPIFCLPLSPQVKGFIKPASCTQGKIKFGTTCEFGCDPGYQLKGPFKTTCRDKGKWSGEHENVRCIDNDPPIIRCPHNIKATTEPNENFALVEWDTPVAKDSSNGKVHVTTIPATKQPMKLKIGKHSIYFIAKDEWGNKAKCIMTVTVEDQEPPRIDRCESPPTFLSRDLEVDVYWEEPIFSDNSGKAIKVTRSKEPGRFPQGETLVEYHATDFFGNTASCNITISVQEHACKLPIDPLNGSANCTEDGSAVYCSLTCENGYAFALRPHQDYFCAYDGIWQPQSNPYPFPECSVSAISNTISHSGEITMEDSSGSVCDDIFFMGQVENKIQEKLENALNEICIDDLLCEISTVEAVCESLLAEAEEEFNSIGFTRKKRNVNEVQEELNRKWIEWRRGSSLESVSRKKRAKRDIRKTVSSHRTQHLLFPMGMFTENTNKSPDKKKEKESSDFMGVLPGLIVQSVGKDIGMTRYSSFLTGLGSKDAGGVDDFLAEFSKEFGDEKTKEVRLLAEKSFGQILSEHEESLDKNFSLESGGSSFSHSTSLHADGNEGDTSQTSKRNVGTPSSSHLISEMKHPVLFPGQTPQNPQNKKQGIKVKFQVEGQANQGSRMINDAFKGLINSAENGEFDLDFGEKQLRVAAIRLSEDPEYKCEPGSVPVDDHCVKCSVGTFFNVITKVCEQCPAGSFQPKQGQVSCLVCPENTSTKTGQAKSFEDCKALCLPGSYSSDTLEPCVTCSMGEYQDEYGSTSCSSCPFETTTWRRGSWLIDECKPSCLAGEVSETGLQPCLPCPMNYFQGETQQKECFKCPEDFSTVSTGSTSLLDCVGITDDSKAAYTSLETLPINDCFSTPCMNGASCEIAEFGYVCKCVLGYTGQQCEEEVNECLSHPCLNNATCEDNLGGFKCLCSEGFEGDLCEINTNECESNPCKNGAPCIDLINSFRCICESGFTGETCEVNIDECEIAPCSKSSTCVDGISNYTCVCPPGFEGHHCNTEINECDSSPCIHGVCSDLVDGFKCDCDEGYSGVKCDIDTDDCSSQPCANNGTCTDWLNDFSCVCLPGFTGKTCETKMSTDFVLEFKTSGILNYAALQNIPRALDEVTVCFWMKTKDWENYGTPFSYATSIHDNALTLTDYSGFVFYVNGEKRITDISANDGEWHMICVVWKSRDGMWAIFKDSIEVDAGDGLSEGKTIEADGVFVLGQEQDQRGGKYSAPESFIGDLTLLNVWGSALPHDTITSLHNKCSRYVGDIRSWPDFQSGIMGNIKMKSLTFCEGCAIPYTPQHGKILLKGSRVGDIAKVTCDEGYKLDKGDEERTCLLNGKWSGVEPECKPVSCVHPGGIQNGDVKGYRLDYGDILTHICNKGFRLNGSVSRTCGADGKWSGSKPECQVIKCPNPTPMENGVIISQVGLYLPTNRVAYSCEKGYQMDGPSYQVCGNSGSWTGNQPSCQPSDCGELPKIDHGTVIKNTGDPSKITASVTCDAEYKIKKEASIVCQENGSWSLPLPKCIRKTCVKPPPVTNGKVKVRVSMEGKQARYKCDRGFVLEGPSLLTCTEDGEWDSPTWSRCLPKPCNTPDVPQFGIIPQKSRWSVGNEVTYECQPGYLISGNPTKKCVLSYDEGIWEGETPTCEAIICSSLNSIEAGTFNIIQRGVEEKPLLVYDEIDILARRRRSAFSEFPSIGSSSSNYDELEDFGSSPSKPITFPKPGGSEFGGQTSGGFDYGGQTSGGFDYGGQKSGGFDYGGQTSGGFDDFGQKSGGFDYGGQTSGGFDDFGQKSGGFDYGGQTSGGFDDFGQKSGGFDYGGQTSGGFDDFGQKSGGFDYGGQTSGGFDYGGQKSGGFDYGGQTSGGFDYTGQTSGGFDDFGQSQDGLDVFSQSDFELVDNYDSQISQNPDELFYDGPYTYNTTAEYKCKQGFRLIGSQFRRCSENGDWDYPEPHCHRQYCPDIQSLGNGYFTYLSSGELLKVEFHCNVGFKIIGAPEIFCQPDGTWSDVVPRCEQVNCIKPLAPENGTVTYESTLAGSIAFFDCLQGFVLEGSYERHCQFDGFWNGSQPRCKEIACKAPAVIDKGYIYYEGNLNVGSIVEYGCNDCYELVGTSVRKCLLNESWSLEEPFCELIKCKPLPSELENGQIIGGDNFCDALVEYECNPGYEMKGLRKASCMDDKEWTSAPPMCQRISCGEPPTLFNGKRTGNSFLFSDQVEYECNEGYTKTGSDILTCTEKATWSGDKPYCAIVNCTKPRAPSNGRVRVSGLFYGASITIVCDPGYKIEGDKKLTCQSNAKWDKEMPFCSPLICPPAPRPIHSFYNSTELYFESFSYLLYQCHEGYTTQIQDTILECNAQGAWEGDIIQCNPVDCGEPGPLKNGLIQGSEYTLGKTLQFSCLKGYEMIGESKATCQPNGLWSEIPTCTKINCGAPNAIKFGFTTVDEPVGDYNTSVYYKCHNGYIISGSSVLTCQENGLWSKPTPTCNPVLCPEPPELVNAEISGDIYQFKHSITIECDDGYSMQGNPVLNCLENGTWSSSFPLCEMTTCDDVTDIPNGKWKTIKQSEIPQKTEDLTAKGRKIKTSKSSRKGKNRHSKSSKSRKIAKMTSLLEEYENLSYRLGHKIEYTCDEGYFKKTTGILECTPKGWSSNPPECHPITCPHPNPIKNGGVIGDDVKYGSTLKYECNEGYDLFGVSTRKCEANKEWTDTEPYCRPKECIRPTQIINGKTIVESIKYQAVISYVCDPGFRLEGEKTRMCQSNEKWSGERPFCVEIFCEEPKEIPYAVTDVTTFKVGGKLNYQCMEGYSMEGKATLTCQSDGSWNDKPPKCVQVDCGPAHSNPHLILSGSSTIYASKVVYSCERGYRLEGVDWTTCLQSGRWSNSAPKCEVITCDAPLQPENGFIVKEEEDDAEVLGNLVEQVPTKTKKNKKSRKQRKKSKGKYKSKTGRLRTPVYYVDDEVAFDCEPGWEIFGKDTLKCTEDGIWSSNEPECKRISCGPPPELSEHAVYSGTNFLYEGEVFYSCAKGYVLRGNPTATCTEDGTWTDNAIVCEPISCGSPPDVDNSHTTYTIPAHGLPHHFGSVVTYACNEGYLHEGSLYMTCEASGTWIGPRESPVCVEMPCEPPPKVYHATAVENKGSKPRSVTYTCDPGYVVSGNTTAYCSLGRWKGLTISCAPVNCQEPPTIVHGKITAKHFTLGGVANYSCVEGHVLEGNPSVLCGQDGKWIGDMPQCHPVDCKDPKTPENGKVTFTFTLYASKAKYRCDKGYELKGDAKRVCSHDGSWSGHLPQCHRISCGELQPPAKGYVIGVGQLFGDEVKFTCEKGHVLIGSESSVCQANGKWSVTEPRCEGVKCGPPNVLMNAEPVKGASHDFVYGDKIYYTCQEGHIPRGDLSSECQNDGTWSDVKGQCSKISCGRPKMNRDGAVILGRSFYYNDKVKIACPSGTKPKGNAFLTCLSDGSWSGEASCISGCNIKCLNGGVCITQNSCSCPSGFMGSRCQHAVCILPCLNGGTCVGPYKCKCLSDFEGPRCQTPLCPLPCLNGGVCTGPHRCTCLPGYVGTRCQTPVCQHGCGLYGKCIGPNVCLCQYGETAESCPEYTDYDYHSQYDETHFNDWDIAALRRRLGKFKN